MNPNVFQKNVQSQTPDKFTVHPNPFHSFVSLKLSMTVNARVTMMPHVIKAAIISGLPKKTLKAYAISPPISIYSAPFLLPFNLFAAVVIKLTMGYVTKQAAINIM